MWNIVVTAFVEYISPFVLGLPSPIQTIIILGILWGVKVGLLKIPAINKSRSEKTHSTCPLHTDHLSIVNRERSKAERIHQIRYYDTVYNQMSRVEVREEEISDLLTDEFSKLLDNSDASEKKKSEARQLYSLILDWALDDARGYLRRWVRKNGFTTYDDVGFQAYIHKRAEELHKLLRKNIDRHWIKAHLVLERKMVYDANLIVFYSKIQTIISDLFVELRQIAEESEKKIIAIEEEKV